MPASVGLMPDASAATKPGKVAEPAACEKKASRRSTIHAPSTPPVTASSTSSSSASRRNGRSARSRGEGTGRV